MSTNARIRRNWEIRTNSSFVRTFVTKALDKMLNKLSDAGRFVSLPRSRLLHFSSLLRIFNVDSLNLRDAF